ncbi:hypothetical protein DPEC_G00186110 [Dallia pectoralis]|uniref:Uncharacterized protein n=1 Tax=Dallia pectoralis TaxID=75939 RepID=A0ACC2GBF1_DALPE|nr:hypothetical protein DPEC_G00186110 [Dallia pectoralis]
MFKKPFCYLLLSGFLFFSIYFWFYLSNSNVTELISRYHDLLKAEGVYSHLSNDSEFWDNKTLTKNNETNVSLVREELNKCPDPSPLLVGPFTVEFSTAVSLESVRKENPHLQEGGRYKPDDCIALQKVAVIIPFRYREEHLKFWLHYLHPFLQRQQQDYRVYVVTQHGDGTFNKAKLMNIGFTEALKEYDYDCFVFSDVDIIPMDDRNLYRCFSQPRHLAVSLDKFGFVLPYLQIFGGATTLSTEQMKKINGFSNTYWGWGGEDDDISRRVTYKGMTISRPDSVIGKCRMIQHIRDEKNDLNIQRFDRMANTFYSMDHDGLNSLEYKIVSVEKLALFTKITADVGEPPK